MPLKTAAIELATGKGKRQKAWEAIRALRGAEWSRVQIARAARIDVTCFDNYLEGLVAAKIVRETRRVENPGRRGACATTGMYVLDKDCGVEAPRVRADGSEVTAGRQQEQMWRTLRMLNKGDISAAELAAHASTSTITVSLGTAQSYLKTLNKAGYLDMVPAKRCPPNPKLSKAARYRLRATRNTGPKPPMICRASAVFDANENRIVWSEVPTEEDVIYAR